MLADSGDKRTLRRWHEANGSGNNNMGADGLRSFCTSAVYRVPSRQHAGARHLFAEINRIFQEMHAEWKLEQLSIQYQGMIFTWKLLYMISLH